MLMEQTDSEDMARALASYKKTGSQELRNQLVVHYLPIVRSAAVQLRDLAERRKLLRALFQKILACWQESIQADLFDDPISQSQMEGVSQTARAQYLAGEGVERAYGATLIAALVTEHYWIGLQQGDGRCIAVRTDGTCEQPIPWDERCEANITTSICDENAVDAGFHLPVRWPPGAGARGCRIPARAQQTRHGRRCDSCRPLVRGQADANL